MGAQAVTDNNFEQEVLKSDQPVLVDFWAEWCGPCRALGPSVDAVAQEKAGALKVVKVNIDENPNAPSKYGVRSIPTLLLFKNGERVDQKVGAAPKGDLSRWISAQTASA